VGGGPDHEGIQFIDLSFYLIIQSMLRMEHHVVMVFTVL
jgi:hypothetical protein